MECNPNVIRTWESNHSDLHPRECTDEDGRNTYFMGLCTVFVATIEETKDRISQLELIFCSQLFPAFQSEISESNKAIKRLEKLLENSTQEWEEAKRTFLQRLEELQSANDAEKKSLLQKQERLEQQRLLLSAENQERDENRQRHTKEMEELRRKNEQILLEKEDMHSILDKVLREAAELRKNCDELRLEKTDLCQRYKEVSLANDSVRDTCEKVSKETEENFRSLQQMSFEKEALQQNPPDTFETKEQDEEKHRRDDDKLQNLQRQFLSVELEKEKRARLRVMQKFQSLKKCHRNLKKQYNFLFRQVDHALLDRRLSLPVRVDNKITNPVVKKFQNNKVFPKLLHSDDSAGGRGDKSHCDIASKAPNILLCDSFTLKNINDGSKLESNSGRKAYWTEDVMRINCSETMDTNERILSLGNREGLLQGSQALAVPEDEEDCVLKQNLSNKNQVQQGYAEGDYVEGKIDSHVQKKTGSFPKSKQDSGSACSPSPESQSVNQPVSSSQGKDRNQARQDQECDPDLDQFQKIETSGRVFNGLLAGGLAKSGQPQPSVHKRAFNSKSGPHGKGLKVAWRNTRFRSDAKGPDLHDDFLNTPLENAINYVADQTERKSTVKNPLKKGVQLPDDAETEFSKSANRTKDCTSRPASDAKAHAIKHTPPKLSRRASGNAANEPKLGFKQGSMFKYVEPVRKKSERENLQGTECNQCKKFYDAVLAEDAEAVITTRCEHHDGVSRHRYRYIPPATPQGFWNIGFDSELGL